MPIARNAARRSLALFCVTLALYLLTSSGRLRVMDEYMVFFQTESLAQSGTLAVPQARQLGAWYGKEGRDGLPYGPYGPAHAMVLVPSYGFGKLLTRAPGVPSGSADLVTGFSVVSFQAVLAALAVVLFHTLLGRLGVSPTRALLVSFGLAFATPLWSYAGTLFSEAWTTLLLLAAAVAVERSTRAEQVQPAPAAVAGVLLALAILTRAVHALAAVLFGAALLFGPGERARRWHAFVCLGGTSAVGLAAYLLYNHSLFGSPFDFGYPQETDTGTTVLAFNQALSVGIFGFLLSPGKSVILFAPPLLAAVAGLPRLWQHRRPLAMIAIAPLLAYLFLYAGYRHWEGGYCYGPRYLVPLIPLTLLGLAPMLDKAGGRARRLVLWLCAAGLFVQTPGVFTSFLEEQVGSGTYYDAEFKYRIAHNPIASQGWLLVGYTGEALRGNALASPLGKGLDLWFLFLRKGGVSWAAIGALVMLQCLLLVVGLVLLRTHSARRCAVRLRPPL
ncbi:MAG: hypothetical protein ACE5MH_08605 [Terriglobia bacterium]